GAPWVVIPTATHNASNTRHFGAGLQKSRKQPLRFLWVIRLCRQDQTSKGRYCLLQSDPSAFPRHNRPICARSNAVARRVIQRPGRTTLHNESAASKRFVRQLVTTPPEPAQTRCLGHSRV